MQENYENSAKMKLMSGSERGGLVRVVKIIAEIECFEYLLQI